MMKIETTHPQYTHLMLEAFAGIRAAELAGRTPWDWKRKSGAALTRMEVWEPEEVDTPAPLFNAYFRLGNDLVLLYGHLTPQGTLMPQKADRIADHYCPRVTQYLRVGDL